jgi:hypothetical protein
LSGLYDTTEKAFPKTELRQHATNPIHITQLKWTPFLGQKTLFIRGLAQHENREYNTIILFKKVNYNVTEARKAIKIIASDDEKEYTFEKLSLENTEVLVRCNCPDFRWRFSYYDHVDHSLFGRKPPKYKKVEGSNRPPANPLELPGMCKHIIKTIEALGHAGIFLE